MPRDNRADWARFEPSAIPTKTETPVLDRFVEELVEPMGQRILDLGCGDGRIASRLARTGFTVVGVDINESAVGSPVSNERLRLLVRDVASARGLDLDEPPFDAVICQLVLSVVGGVAERRSLLRNAYDALRPGGRLYLSASGVSDAINPAYARLYEEDFARTHERHTYLSRDSDGNVLYATHHFEPIELSELVSAVGFEDVLVEKKREASSRRPDEAAYFLYVTSRKPEGTRNS